VSRRVLSIAAIVVVLGGGLLWLFLVVLRTQAPAPGAINLQGWKLTLPVEGKSGNAAIIEPAALTEPWLTEGPDGSLTFWAPAMGATTKNSDHPRTELNSLNNFSAATSGPHTLKASLAVSQVPADSKDIIIGQIHGADDISSVPFVMLHYRDGEVRVVVKQKQSGKEAQTFSLLTAVPLNERFDFALSDIGNGTMVFSAGYAGNTQQVTAQVPDAFHGETVRFQVGDYQQADVAQGENDGGRVTFYEINELSTAP
jgi:hypothetical protein